MVYDDETGGYSKEALALSDEVKEALSPIIDKYQKEGMSVEAILYVAYSEIQTRCVYNRIQSRIKK